MCSYRCDRPLYSGGSVYAPFLTAISTVTSGTAAFSMMITSIPFLSVIFFHCGWASAPSDNVTATSANKNKAAATRAVAKRFLIFTSPSQPRMRAISCHISYATLQTPYFTWRLEIEFTEILLAYLLRNVLHLPLLRRD